MIKPKNRTPLLISVPPTLWARKVKLAFEISKFFAEFVKSGAIYPIQCLFKLKKALFESHYKVKKACKKSYPLHKKYAEKIVPVHYELTPYMKGEKPNYLPPK